MLLLLLGLGITFTFVYARISMDFMNKCVKQAERTADDSNPRD